MFCTEAMLHQVGPVVTVMSKVVCLKLYLSLIHTYFITYINNTEKQYSEYNRMSMNIMSNELK